MNALYRLRLSHAALAVFATAAYLTGEEGSIHQWLGYGVAAIVIVRIGLAFTGAPQLGLMRFYPSFDGLRLGNLTTHPAISRTLLAGIAICVIGAVATGIVMDKGRTLGFAAAFMLPVAMADDDADDEAAEGQLREGKEEDGMEEIHEVFSNVLLILVALHIAYLFAFKRPLARFMLFAGGPKRRTGQSG